MIISFSASVIGINTLLSKKFAWKIDLSSENLLDPVLNYTEGCKDRLRKRYSHLVEGSFLAGKVAWTLSGCMTTESADYCMLVNEWAWSRSRV